MKTLIMLHGKKRSGKGAVALAMKKHLVKAKIVSFATPLKHILATTFNMPSAILEEYKNEGASFMHGVPDAKNIDGGDFRLQTYREAHQLIGDGIKSVFGSTVFAHLACKQIEKAFDLCDYVIVDDLRLEQDEYWFVREFFSNSVVAAHGTVEVPYINIKTVTITRPDLFSNDGHITENGMIDFEFDYQINNSGSIEELQIKAQEILND